MESAVKSAAKSPNVVPAAHAPGFAGVLQRKCACGGSAGLTDKCEDCNRQKRRLQTKLKVNEPGDIYEQEADRIADQVMSTPAHSRVNGTPQRIQRYTGRVSEKADAASPSVDKALASPGRPLDPPLRQDMERRFGHDFSRVRVHLGAAAEQSTRAVRALAYTFGSNIVFRSGEYSPTTHKGRRLLAHELVHVIQQDISGCGSRMPLQRQAAVAEPEVESAVEEEEVYEYWMARGEEGTYERQEELTRLGEGASPRPMYRDIGAHTDWSAASERRGKQLEAWHRTLSLERPQMTLLPGGSPPDFITEGRPSQSLREGDRSPAVYTPRFFHVLDAIDYDVGLASTSDEIYGLYFAYLLDVQRTSAEVAVRNLPESYKARNGKIYHPKLPRGAAVGGVIVQFGEEDTSGAARMRAFTAALANRALARRQQLLVAAMTEAEKTALKGKKRREGPCKNSNNPPKSKGSPASDKHNRYARHVAEVKGYGTVNDELTWTTPEGVSYSFDTYNPKNKSQVWEAKTQHEWASPLGMAKAPYSVRDFNERILGLETQRLTGLYVANRCGLEFRYALDNCRFYQGLTIQWLLPPLEYIPYQGEQKVPCPPAITGIWDEP